MHEQHATRFWSKVDKTGVCWLWTAGTFEKGYGVFRMYGRNYRAHRVAWELMKGPIPEGLSVLHNCPDGDNKLCVRHLWLGTHLDNMRDGVGKGQFPIGDASSARRHPARRVKSGVAVNPELRRRGETHWNARLTELAVITIHGRAKSGERLVDLAREFGMSHGAVSAIAHERTWRHLWQ
jgi:hypothetical protein